MVLHLVIGALIIPLLPYLLVRQGLSYIVYVDGMYALMIVVPVIGMLQLASLRKQVTEVSKRIAISCQEGKSVKTCEQPRG
jgi:VIT1/CCC1 family predicted Fe2+/Mn2+ transporter